MKINTYVVHRIIITIPNIIISFCERIVNLSWYLCHYRYGKFKDNNPSSVIVTMPILKAVVTNFKPFDKE